MVASCFADVVLAAAGGDREALGGLWRAWNPRLVRYLAGRGARSAEDLAADVWLDVARGLPRFKGDERAWARWLFTIGRHRLIDEGRVRGRRPETLSDVVPAINDAGAGPEDVVVGRAGLAEAVALVCRLPADQADTVLLRVLAGLDVADVAEILGKQPGAVRVLTHRGLRRLAELVPSAAQQAQVGSARESCNATPLAVVTRGR